MENKLILHIGMPKTGTSAIQGFLYDNRDRLNKYNISYPDLIEDMTKRGYVVATRPEGRTKNGVSLNHFRSWDNMECISPAVITEWNVYTDLINSYLKDSSVIISDEDLWCQGNNYVLIRELKKICSNIEIIVYLRRQDLEIEAIWNQVVKRYGYCSLDFKDARERWENDRLVSYFEILSNIEKIVGLENMNIRVYEKSQMYGDYGDIVEDFMTLLGITDLSEFKRGKSINDRLDGSILEIKKSYNKVIVHDEWLRGIMEERFLSSLEYIRRGSKEGYYSLDERKEIIARFSEENEKIARYFLGRDNGILFSDEIIDVPMHTDNINVNDIISIFTYIMLQQEREINELKKELYETEWLNIVQKNRKDRELILFGAGYICDRFLSSCLLDVQYVVDNNKTKSGSYIHGIPIVHTADIDQWSEYYVIITCGAYVDIEKQLETYGLKKESDYFTYTDNLSV